MCVVYASVCACDMCGVCVCVFICAQDTHIGMISEQKPKETNVPVRMTNVQAGNHPG